VERKRVTINDIAEHAGVSRSTVSLVLQDHPRISGETRERVQRSIRDLGYTYNRSAANLRRQTSQAIGLIINDICNPFFSELTSAIEETAAEFGYFVYLVESAEDPERQHQVLMSLIEHDVAGLIICPATGTPPETLDRLYATGVPMCLAVRPYPDDRLDFAGPDNYAAANLAATYLIEAGHRRIAFLGGERQNPSRIDRLSGYFSALQRHGIEFDPALVVESRPSRLSGIADVERVLKLADRPTAALCYNDFVGISVMHGLRRNGLEPGKDMALIGFDGMPEAELAFPPLSTVSLHPRSIGRNAAQLVIDRIKDPARKQSRRVEQPTLILRESSNFRLPS
jgi:LacI family transcriptional regulator